VKLIRLIALGLVIVAPASRADAQGLEFSAGYQVLHIPDETYPFGLSFDAAGRKAGWTGVGEFAWARDSQTEPGLSGTLNFISYGAGPRWNSAASGTRTFAQILVGGVRASASLTRNGAPFSASTNAFMIQPGVGVVADVGPAWGVVGQVDYRRAFFEDNGENEFRFVIGIRLALDR